MWQKCKKVVKGDEDEWFENQVIGRDPLNDMMKTISKDAQLSKLYTNHSIRATCLTKLDQAGFEIRHIQAISGHKSEESIKAYSTRCPENKKREMAAALDLPVEKNPQKFPLEADKIVDFVPIEGNADDFDLGKIIESLEKGPTTSTTN